MPPNTANADANGLPYSAIAGGTNGAWHVDQDGGGMHEVACIFVQFGDVFALLAAMTKSMFTLYMCLYTV